MVIELYFSQHFGVSPTVLEDYGAFDISLASDLPLFIDPFLLFNSQKPEYRDLHEGMIRYLVFLRDRATPDLDPGLIKSWYIRMAELDLPAVPLLDIIGSRQQ